MKTDDAWKSLAQVNEWIRFADVKAGAVLAGSGVLGGLLIKAIPDRATFHQHPARATLISLAIICVGCSALITLRTLAPRLRTGEARSMIYFDHIARKYAKDRSTFVDRYISLADKEEDLVRQLIDQVWSNSMVARRKFRRVSFAVVFLGSSMAFSGTSVILQRVWDL
ncbi:hypothetical protein Dvina_52290 [Dactylosporangium vinaceum]|uniref:Pycsar system effector family protein n=1 Tax=Dactylosporangium vinaceum TaxID=53362 RepID=A0ABV5MQM7_9ACTN|nr:Pycsar system effector family protein [Dactylosporangium vinaceum]UAB96410.1 hypothetical protein Dvina_52290 [Dactylosporangium vinaceum]